MTETASAGAATRMVAGAELVAPAGGGLLVSRDVRIEVEAEAVPPAVTTASPAGRDAHAA